MLLRIPAPFRTSFRTRSSASWGAVILSVTAKYLTILVKRSTTTRMAFLPLVSTVWLDFGRPVIKSSKMSVQDLVGVSSDCGLPYSLCVRLLDLAQVAHVSAYYLTSFSMPGQ